jgi:hypothetical protein
VSVRSCWSETWVWNYREIERILSEKYGIHALRCTNKDFVRREAVGKREFENRPPLCVEDANLLPHSECW